jgi:glucan phosphoethanolaminetransferase (alkaline phosphatase superfamily)
VKSFFKHVLLALTVAYIALLPQFYEIFSAANRYSLLWDRTMHASIVTAVFAIALLYGAAYFVVYLRWRPAERWRLARDVALVVVLLGILTRSAVSILDRSGEWPGISEVLARTEMKVIYYVLLPLLATALNPFVVKRAVRRLYSLLTPMMAFGLLWPATFRTYDVREPPVPEALSAQLATAATPGTTNVFIFMLDEWSYARTFDAEGRASRDMPRLNELLNGATLYRNARSPGPTTSVSVPRFLAQDNKLFRTLEFKTVRARTLGRFPIRGRTLFSHAPQGLCRLAIGFWIDYPALLGTNVDFAASIHQEAGTRSYGIQTLGYIDSQFGFLRYLGVSRTAVNLAPSLLWIYSQEQAHRWALQVIGHMNQPTFAYFHYCLPHYPYVWNAQGKKAVIPADPNQQTVDNYHGNLLYLDRVLGEVVDALKRAGKYDSSMLVLTSDHSWRKDPLDSYTNMAEEDAKPDTPLRHVPLIVKMPGQTERRIEDERFSTADLHVLIRRALAPEKVSASPR